MKEVIENLVKRALSELGLPEVAFVVEHPADVSHGDYSVNVAMVLAKDVGKNPKEIAEELKDVLTDVYTSVSTQGVERVEVADPGFINFHLKREFFAEQVNNILEHEDFGKNKIYAGKKVMVECATPNVFKPLHIGHLMDSSIGEAIARLLEFCGAEVRRDFYSGDVGLHVAKALWGMKQLGDKMPAEDDSLAKKAEFLGNAYVHGSQMYEENEDVKKEIDELNVRVYKGTEEELKNLYEIGRGWSLEHFQEIFEILGIRIDFSYFESQTSKIGEKIVRENTPGVFEESEGAIVYKGEKEGLHTRVFLTTKRVPLYEAKELALPILKNKDYPYDEAVVITAVEQEEYFKVVMAALRKIDPLLGKKIIHVTHGMMQLASGKMSSRKGNVITGESLLRETIERVEEVVRDREGLAEEEKKAVAKAVGVAAIKYSILKQSSGKNIVYDEKKAISFEGDSGPYLQYTYARARSVLRKAEEEGCVPDAKDFPEEIFGSEKLLYQFPEVLQKSVEHFEPHYLSTYLTELAGSFNSFYSNTQIVDGSKDAPYKLAITGAVAQVLKSGLWVLGIEAPERM